MKKSRFTDEQVIGFLRQAESGMVIKGLCRLGGYQAMSLRMRRSKSAGSCTEACAFSPHAPAHPGASRIHCYR